MQWCSLLVFAECLEELCDAIEVETSARIFDPAFLHQLYQLVVDVRLVPHDHRPIRRRGVTDADLLKNFCQITLIIMTYFFSLSLQ